MTGLREGDRGFFAEYLLVAVRAGFQVIVAAILRENLEPSAGVGVGVDIYNHGRRLALTGKQAVASEGRAARYFEHSGLSP